MSSCLASRRWAAVVLLIGSGCSGSVNVQQTFPVPLVERMPLRIAVHYAPALAAYTYKEAAAAERDWTVQLGTANVRMFDAVFSGLFAVTQRVSGVETAAQEIPSQSATDQFAVWIRYNVDVYGPDGQLIVRWPVAAYGQSGSGGLSDEKSMERATVLALRDAAATIAVNFAKQPKIREALLKENRQDAP